MKGWEREVEGRREGGRLCRKVAVPDIARKKRLLFMVQIIRYRSTLDF